MLITLKTNKFTRQSLTENLIMKKLWTILLKGSVAVFPALLTLYFFYWLVTTIEKTVSPLIMFIIPEQYYVPGIGLLVGICFLFCVGLLVNAWIFKWVFGLGEKLLERIPLIKSVYGALRDFMHYFSPSGEQKELKKVVMVSINNMQLIGFMVSEAGELSGVDMPDDKVAVYLPMSYQIGGFTVYISKENIQLIDMSVEDAMRQVLTAGLSKKKTAP